MSKIAVVTGGTSGIGKETALYLAKNGCTVYELSRRAEGVAGLRHISADVTDEASVRRAVEQILQEAGQIDILVNNAGITKDKLVPMMKAADFDAVIDTNLKGAFYMTKGVYPLFLKQKGGKIINISSIGGVMGIPYQGFYSAVSYTHLTLPTIA